MTEQTFVHLLGSLIWLFAGGGVCVSIWRGNSKESKCLAVISFLAGTLLIGLVIGYYQFWKIEP